MAFTQIRAVNFKSFDELEVQLDNFCVILGANASGKSNFVQAFAFIRDIANFGLVNAVSMQGGADAIRNLNIGSSVDMELAVSIDDKYDLLRIRRNATNYGVTTSGITYSFRLGFGRSRTKFK